MTTTIKLMLRAAVFTGAVGLLPTVALAETGSEPNGAAVSEPSGAGVTAGVPDHATAEARGAGTASAPSGAVVNGAVPDHAAAEARSAAGQP